MKIIGYLILFSLAAFSSVEAQSEKGSSELRSRVYAPTLSVDHVPICKAILSGLQSKFLSTSPFDEKEVGTAELEHDAYSAWEDAASPDPEIWRGELFKRFSVGDKQLFFQEGVNPGCGGGCETEYVAVFDQLPTAAEQRAGSGKPLASTPASKTWQLYKDRQGQHYFVGIEGTTLHAYQVDASIGLRLQCSIALEPENLRTSTDPDLQSAEVSIAELERAYQAVSGGYGSCGSLHSGDTAQFQTSRELQQSIYRPWFLASYRFELSHFEADLDTDPIANINVNADLIAWSFNGVYEYRKLNDFRMQIRQTANTLSQFYVRKFHWPTAQSKAMANAALASALSNFAFPTFYVPFPDDGEQQLRQEILERQSISSIAAIAVKIPEIEKSETESLLSVAITYPDAVRYLLEKGADPNKANEFGKTPLMYAAQYNQEDSAAILLENGADPNLVTTWPSDTCSYTLQTSNMSALHYAVRYASARFVRLLLDHGAASYIKTDTRRYREVGEYPLEWLKKYAVQNAEESNANMSPRDVQELTDLLAVPSDDERIRISDQLTKQAEVDYAQGKINSAFTLLNGALKAQGDNEKALRDMSLVALKSGRLGVAMKSADAVISANTSTAAVADAWFNKGLACEQNKGQSIMFDGQYYCMGRIIDSFLTSYKLGPSKSRGLKIISLFRDGKLKVGAVAGSGAIYHFSYVSEFSDKISGGQRVYVLHKISTKIDPKSIVYVDNNQKREFIGPQLVESIDLGGDMSITILRSDQYYQGPITIDGKTYSDPR